MTSHSKQGQVREIVSSGGEIPYYQEIEINQK